MGIIFKIITLVVVFMGSYDTIPLAMSIITPLDLVVTDALIIQIAKFV
jgi:hypothetical protein